VRFGQRWRSNCWCVVQELFLVVLASLVLIDGVFGRTLSREISSPDETFKSRVFSKPREITLPDEMWRRCQPVPHDVLWLRLNIAPRLPSNGDVVLASGSQVQQTATSYNVLASTDQQPEIDTDFQSQDGGSRRRHRRDTEDNERRRPRRRELQQQHNRRHSRKRARRLDLLTKLSERQAWLCRMTSHWLRMPDDVFPPYIQTGTCTQSRCMMGLYECRARKYSTRILRRRSDRCNPLPVVGDVTGGGGFEEAWMAEEYHVVVGCECSKRRTSGWYDGTSHNL